MLFEKKGKKWDPFPFWAIFFKKKLAPLLFINVVSKGWRGGQPKRKQK